VAEVCRRFLADEQDFSKENLKRAEITRFINNEKMDCAIYQIEEMIIEKKW
jgi:guanylate kinase